MNSEQLWGAHFFLKKSALIQSNECNFGQKCPNSIKWMQFGSKVRNFSQKWVWVGSVVHNSGQKYTISIEIIVKTAQFWAHCASLVNWAIWIIGAKFRSIEHNSDEYCAILVKSAQIWSKVRIFDQKCPHSIKWVQFWSFCAILV